MWSTIKRPLVAFRAGNSSGSRPAAFAEAQVKALVTLAPLTSLASAATAAVIAVTFWKADQRAYLGGLVTLVELLAGLILMFSWQWRRNPDTGWPAARLRSAITLLAGLIGGLWTSLPLVVFTIGSANERMLLAGTMVGLIATGIILAPVIEAALAFMLPMLAGCFIALSLRPEPFFFLIDLLLLFYGAFIVGSVVYLSLMFVSRVSERMAFEDQEDTISLLLGDVADGTNNCLWALEAGENIQVMLSRLASDLSGRSGYHNLAVVSGADELPAHIALARLSGSVAERRGFRQYVVQVRLDGLHVWWSLTGLPYFGLDGQFKGFRGVASDITAAGRNGSRYAKAP